VSRYQPVDVADIALIAPAAAAAAAAGCLLRARGVLLKLCSPQLCKEDACWTAERHIRTAAVVRSASGVISLSDQRNRIVKVLQCGLSVPDCADTTLFTFVMVCSGPAITPCTG
jgi:hypothetical protein